MTKPRPTKTKIRRQIVLPDPRLLEKKKQLPRHSHKFAQAIEIYLENQKKKGS
jgi:hypothetical protein